jgi:hypothetical protein
MNRSINATLAGCAVLLAATVVLASIVAATYGLDNIRMIEAFNLDEGTAITRMTAGLEQFSLDPDGFYYYANIYHSTGYYCISFLEFLGWKINTFLAGFVLRLVSIVSLALAGLSLWKLGRICGLPTAVAAGTALGLLTMPDFVRYSRIMHPDVLQTVFVIASLGFALVRPTFPFALISAAAAGLAFGTKYIGAIVLPFSFLPLELSTLGHEGLTREVVRRLFLQGLAIVGVFAATFTLTNPYAVFDYRSFVSMFIGQLRTSSTGFGIVQPASPLLWLEPLREQFGIVGMLYLFGGFALACIFLARDIRRGGWRAALVGDDLRTRLVLILYVLAASAHLAISVHQREARYTYHVVPFLLIVSTRAVFELVTGLPKRIASPRWSVPVFAVALLAFASTQVKFDLRAMAEATKRPDSDFIKLGNFVAQHYPADIKILADAYTYLPPSLTNVTDTNMQSEALLNDTAPDLIVLTRGATGSAAWKAPGTQFADGKFVRDERYATAAQAEAYLNKLHSPASGWSVVRETPSEVILQRNR